MNRSLSQLLTFDQTIIFFSPFSLSSPKLNIDTSTYLGNQQTNFTVTLCDYGTLLGF